jgi:hypothetical protein
MRPEVRHERAKRAPIHRAERRDEAERIDHEPGLVLDRDNLALLHRLGVGRKHEH